MLRYIKALYACDSCTATFERTMLDGSGQEGKGWKKAQDEIDLVATVLKNSMPPDWIRDDMGNMWCDECHQKKILSASFRTK